MYLSIVLLRLNFLRILVVSLLLFTGRVKGHRIIDIGCGPTIHSLIPAAKWFDELYLADFSPRNLQAVQQWLQRDPESFDWQTHFKLFADKDGNRYGKISKNCQRVKQPLTVMSVYNTNNQNKWPAKRLT